tara:strand:- start:65 stop:1411 length:1347 start_codon:yes stop_codon:yes gene_type:complete
METTQNVPAYKVVSNYNPSTVYVDPDIQRPLGNWDKDTDLRYSALRAYNRNRMTSPIVLADAEECLRYVMKTQPDDTKSVNYFENVLAKDNDKGRAYRYIVLDGQHRLLDVLYKFFNNKWQYTGKLLDADGKLVDIDNQYFNQMPIRVKDSLNDCFIPIRVFDDLDEAELPRLFIDHQKGVPLNEQQKRRAEPTPLTPWIRLLGEQNVDATSLLKGCATATCENEELIAKLLIETVRSWGEGSSIGNNISDSSLNKLYYSGIESLSIFAPGSPYVKSEFRRFEDIFDKFTYTLTRLDKQCLTRFRNKHGNISKRLGTSPTWCLWWAMELIVDEGYSINDVTLTYESIIELLANMKNKSIVRYAKDVEISELAGSASPYKGDYFFQQIVSINGKGSAPLRAKARNSFVKALKRNAKFNQGCSIVPIPTAEQLTLQLASTEATVMQEHTL